MRYGRAGAARVVGRVAGVVAAALVASAVQASAGPALLFDVADGRVLYSEDADHLWHPASLTKVMTAYVTFQAIKSGKLSKDTKLPVSELAWSQPPSKVGLPVGATMTVELALQALIVKSANDVAVMLAEGISGNVEAFVTEMNRTARQMGMTRTVFVNPNGLPAAEQVTTARDLGRLARAVLRDFPEHTALWTQDMMRIGRLRLKSHNGLLRTYEGADGLKTGFTCDSGYNVIATATREGRKVVTIVLGEANGKERNLRAASLLEHGFQTGGWRQLFSQTPTLETLPVAADAKQAVSSVRSTVMTWDCGNRRRPASNAVAKVKQQRKALKQQQAAAPADATGTATPSGTAPPLKPSTASTLAPATTRPGSAAASSAAKSATATDAPAAAQPKLRKTQPAAEAQPAPAASTKTN